MRRAAGLVLLCCVARVPAQGAPVHGTIVDAHDRPVVGVTVAVEASHVVTDSSGRFAILVGDPGAAVLRFEKRGFASASLPVASRASVGTVRLPAGAPIVGRCVDAAGRPLDGIEVVAIDQLAELPFVAAEPGPNLRFEARARSAADGTFHIDGGIRAGARVIAVPASGRSASCGPVEAGEPVEVVVHPVRTMRGRVVDSHGFPIDEAIAFVTSDAKRIADATTDRDGWFELLVPDTPDVRLGAHVVRRGERIAAESLALADRSPDEPLILRISDAGRVALHVAPVDPATGRVVPGASIGVALHAPDELGPVLLQQLLAHRCRPTPSGARTVSLLAPGTPFVVAVRAPGRGRAQLVGRLTETRVLDVPLFPEAIVRGRTIDARSGGGVAGVRIGVLAAPDVDGAQQAVLTELPVVETVSGDDGQFELRELGPGRWRAFATLGHGHPIATCEWTVAAGEVVDHAPILVDVGLSVRGRLRHAPPDAAVRVWSRRSTTDDPPPLAPLLDDGAFALENVPTGPGELQLVLPMPARLGGLRAVSLLTLDVTERVLELDVDAAESVAGVSGAVACEGAALPRGRLGVWLEPWPAREPRHGIVDGVWALVADDGRFTATVELGEHNVHVVDIATGVVLRSFERTITGPSLQLGTLDASAVRVDVSIPVASTSSRRRVAVDVGAGPVAGIELGLGQTRCELFVPARGGRLSLQALDDTSGRELAGTFVRPAGATFVAVELRE